ncbi:HAD-IA family hydrolase [Methylocella tundrae]|uniref:HAD-superfamily hydrolase, subfamily IA, variant 3 n=1 Tax=Methylocella tundrae TaxID=227605 RepID=A0A4U8Z5G0_METTU|nr:HAD-IA family hydrolase [Methylocella tundrae]WPP04394.1 HAD-IA family hydrolase [Methylocella tundrae]VFU10750.1 HAD-superfamily hydrolase, subfamily IA, variant 3 [Methylocella tundrae]
MNPSAPTIIFDLGGVLIRHDNDILYDRLAACCADPGGARVVMENILGDEEIGTGQLGVDALHARLVSEQGFGQSFAHFLDLWSSHFSAEPGMEPLLLALAQRYRVVVFSNTNSAHIEHIRANYRVLEHAHAAYMSYELGLVKPYAGAFRKVLELEGRRPEECIFIDDRPENTAAAAALGIKTVTFTDREALKAAIAEYGVAVDA